jgi:uncharacterized membrane protein required for colicin V production
MKFNWLDIVLILSGLWGLFVGIRRGILGELVLTAGFVASLVLAVFMSPQVWQKVSSQFSLDFEVSNSTVAWSIIIIGFVLSLIISKIIQALSHLIFKSKIDQMLGGLLGFVRVIGLAGVLITFLVVMHNEFIMQHAQESIMASFLTQKVNEAHDFLKQRIDSAEVQKTEAEVVPTGEGAEKVQEVQNQEVENLEEEPQVADPQNP